MMEAVLDALSVPPASLAAMSLWRRPASELPGDPASLRLIYTNGHPAIPYDYEDTLEHWGVSVRYFHGQDTECVDG